MTLTRTFLATSSMTHVPMPCDDTRDWCKAQAEDKMREEQGRTRTRIYWYRSAGVLVLALTTLELC